MHPTPARIYLILALGVFAVGWAAILIRLADAPALSIAAYRLCFAALPVAALAGLRHRPVLQAQSRRSWLVLTCSGLALAAHFATWIASLQYTSVTSSVALVTTQPLWAALIGATFLREPVSRRTVAAILLAAAGGALIGLRDVRAGGEALLGDALALAGAVCAAVYFILGRHARGRLDLGAYVGVVYPVAALTLLVVAVAGRQPLSGFDGRTWLMFLLLALGPQLVGHSSLNWALRFLPAHLVAVAVLGEPVLSTLIAIPVLGEWPGPLRVAGGLVTLAGVYLAVREEGRAARAAATTPSQ